MLITYLGYLYISRQNRVCIPIFSLLPFDFVFSISQGSTKNFVSSRCRGGGCMVAICSQSPNNTELQQHIFFSFVREIHILYIFHEYTQLNCGLCTIKSDMVWRSQSIKPRSTLWIRDRLVSPHWDHNIYSRHINPKTKPATVLV